MLDLLNTKKYLKWHFCVVLVHLIKSRLVLVVSMKNIFQFNERRSEFKSRQELTNLFLCTWTRYILSLIVLCLLKTKVTNNYVLIDHEFFCRKCHRCCFSKQQRYNLNIGTSANYVFFMFFRPRYTQLLNHNVNKDFDVFPPNTFS